MRNQLQKRKSEGFTIIEVMIVLAIAGLILLIVFLAVPALQRNAHNTSIKNDVSAILGAVNEYSNNNNGAKAPATATLITGTTATIGTSCGTAGANCATASVSNNITSGSVVTAVPGSAPALGVVTIITGATCNGNTPTTSGATGRSVAAYFTLEGGSVQCQAS